MAGCLCCGLLVAGAFIRSGPGFNFISPLICVAVLFRLFIRAGCFLKSGVILHILSGTSQAGVSSVFGGVSFYPFRAIDTAQASELHYTGGINNGPHRTIFFDSVHLQLLTNGKGQPFPCCLFTGHVGGARLAHCM